METISKLASEVAHAAAPHADRHDRDGTFVREGAEAARDLGYLAAPVPEELGGGGATTAEVAAAQRIVARSCGSTALATTMHLHVVLAAAWRWRRGHEVVEPMLRRVANEDLVVVSTGGGDWVRPTTTATPVDGGWRVSGRKAFASLSPVAQTMATFAVIEGTTDVIAFGCPFSAEGVRIEETWDAVGMRGTGSHEVVLEDVLVTEAQVTARRTWGVLDGPLLVASLHAWPVVAATYLGVAEALVEEVTSTATAADARQVGLLDAHLRNARWALDGTLREIGDDPEPSVGSFVLLQQMKRTVALAGLDIASAVAELAGGRRFARRDAVDRMVRDLRAAVLHPYGPEATLELSGRHALGLDLAVA
jgi:alkylation response protein AidB-like acyl-CoA dehydrogenase